MMAYRDMISSHSTPRLRATQRNYTYVRTVNSSAVIGSDMRVGRVYHAYIFTLGLAEDSLRRHRPVTSHDEVEARNPNHVREWTEVVDALVKMTMDGLRGGFRDGTIEL